MNVYLKIDHTFEILKLPFIHKDPFDRILIAQARYEDMILITDDIEIKKYDVLISPDNVLPNILGISTRLKPIQIN